MLELEERGEFC